MAISGYSEDNFKAIDAFLSSKNLSNFAKAGIIGNLYKESKLDPGILQSSGRNALGWTSQQYTEAVNNGTYNNFCNDRYGYGLCQWTSAGRKEGYLNAARCSKRSIGDMSLALEWLWEELCSRGYKSCVLEPLYNVKSVDEAARIVMCKFERPKDQSEENQKKRSDCCMEFYNKYYANSKSDSSILNMKYTIIKGDKLYRIALNNNLTLEELLAANPDIVNPSKISIGQVINIPIKKQQSVKKISVDDTEIEKAKYKDTCLSGTYKTRVDLNLRTGAGNTKNVIIVMPANSEVKCYGYYSKSLFSKWYLVQYVKNNIRYTGFCDSKYLE